MCISYMGGGGGEGSKEVEDVGWKRKGNNITKHENGEAKPSRILFLELSDLRIANLLKLLAIV